jgi:phosphatidylcholine synthase
VSAAPYFAIHLLTASGGAMALFAAIAAADGDWRAAFVWLGAALFVDGIDGPIARRFKVSERLPDWNGATLDLVIDYTSYVFVPAIILARGCGLSPTLGAIAAGVVALIGAIYFADTRMKQPDNSFRGFPAVWNMAVFVIFACTPAGWFTFVIVVILAIFTFLPVNFVHPVRVLKWRPLTLAVLAVWIVDALWLIAIDFSAAPALRTVLIGASLYLLCVSAVQQYLARS